MRIRKSDLFSLKECFAAYMAIKKAKYPEAVEDELVRKVFALTDFSSAKPKPNEPSKKNKDVSRAVVVQHFQETLGPMSVNESIHYARSIQRWVAEGESSGWLSIEDVKSFEQLSENIKELFPLSNEHKHSVSRGKKHLKDQE